MYYAKRHGSHGITQPKLDRPHINKYRRFRRSVEDTRVSRSTDKESDHYILWTVMRLKPKGVTKYNEKEGKRYDTAELEEGKIKVRYTHWLGRRANGI